MTKTITKPALARALREVAAERPDYIQPRCDYFFSNGRPMCLVGNALKRLAPDEFRLATIGKDNNGTTIRKLAVDVLPNIGIVMTDAARQHAQRVQNAADFDVPWGNCLTGKDSEFDKDA